MKDIDRIEEVVPIDLNELKKEQESVDAGHSPWKLDPIFVTQVFVSLLLYPEGITGDYPIPYQAIRIVRLNNSEATTKICSEKSPVQYVYLRRLVRPGSTGIWSVVGYDKKQMQISEKMNYKCDEISQDQ